MSTKTTRLFVVLVATPGLFLGLLAGCGEDPVKRTPDGGDIGAGEGVVPTGPGLMGTIKDTAGVPVEGAQVDVGGELGFSDSNGKYTVTKLTPGAATVKVTQDWFKDKTESATIQDTGMTTLDLTIEEHPLKLDPADQTLADTYNQTFDWTKDKLSIVVLTKATRMGLDNAIYFRNPALYRDTSGDTLTPTDPLPELSGGAKNFDFQSGGKPVLDSASIKDKLSETSISTTDWMVWKPLLTYLKDWDATKAAGINDAGVAVRQQTWGDSAAVRPQDIDRVFLHADELWVEVVFESFVNVGAGITDSDGDGRKEVFAKLAADHYTGDVMTQIKSYIGQNALDTHGLSKETNTSLNELYTKTAAEVEKYIAQPYDLPDSKGTIAYPFVVLKHSGGEINVLLVGP